MSAPEEENKINHRYCLLFIMVKCSDRSISEYFIDTGSDYQDIYKQNNSIEVTTCNLRRFNESGT